jgi:hypothetical protein
VTQDEIRLLDKGSHALRAARLLALKARSTPR